MRTDALHEAAGAGLACAGLTVNTFHGGRKDKHIILMARLWSALVRSYLVMCLHRADYGNGRYCLGREPRRIVF